MTEKGPRCQVITNPCRAGSHAGLTTCYSSSPIAGTRAGLEGPHGRDRHAVLQTFRDPRLARRLFGHRLAVGFVEREL